MCRGRRGLLCGILVTMVVASSLPAVGVASGSADVHIQGVHPNPVTTNNVGEFVVLRADESVNVSGWTLDDGTRTAQLSNTTIEGHVAASTAPALSAVLTDRPVIALDGGIRFAADGDEVTLRNAAGQPVDTLVYPRTDRGTSWRRDGSTLTAVDRLATHWSFETHGDVQTEAFVFPDSPAVPNEVLRNATDRIYLAGYEFTDPEIVELLLAAVEEDVSVAVLVDGNPVGGQSTQEREALDALVAGGIDVRVMESSRDPYQFHHPKYAVVDDALVVMSENWKPSGTGGASSRGWGVTVNDPGLADEGAAVFDGDFRGPAAVGWTRHRRTAETRPGGATNGSFPLRHDPATTTADAVRLVAGPEAIADRQLDAITNASESIRIQQVSIGDMDFPLLAAAIDAARRGVTVRILLDQSWYVRPDNQALARELNQLADREALPLEARLVDPGGAFDKIHAKGVVVDERTVFVGSANWNNVSMFQNRELVVEVTDPALGAFFAATFDADWHGTSWRTPIGLAVAAAVAWLTAGVFATRRITFAPPSAD